MAFVLVLYYLRKTRARDTRLHVALGLVGGGAIGNLDRPHDVRQGHRLHRLEGTRHEWPAFNIADAALCIGVGLMVLDMFVDRERERPNPSGSRNATATE